MSVIAFAPQPQDVCVDVLNGDLDDGAFERASGAATLAWDIETTGLDWRTDAIGTVQIKAGAHVYVVRLNGAHPLGLRSLLEDGSIVKVMHHAMFDLRFMAHQWCASPRAVACTKIASKLATPSGPMEDHSLAALVRRHFGVQLDKSQRLTDWRAELRTEQINYAADDVRFLEPLYAVLDRELREKGRLELRARCYEHLSTRVELDIGGYPDVYDY